VDAMDILGCPSTARTYNSSVSGEHSVLESYRTYSPFSLVFLQETPPAKSGVRAIEPGKMRIGQRLAGSPLALKNPHGMIHEGFSAAIMTSFLFLLLVAF